MGGKIEGYQFEKGEDVQILLRFLRHGERTSGGLLEDYVRETYELAAKPKRLYELDSDHDYRYHPSIITEVEKTIIEFLDEN